MTQAKKHNKTKYLFVTGGVLSSLGKGIASSSIAFLLKQRGYSVTILKLDPYINIDPGTMNPTQHGEVYVTDDGAETDLDLGHYERFLDESLSQKNNLTAGRVYYDVIKKERKGQYLGKTVQVVPHITNEIKNRMKSFDGEKDFVLIEIGGTVGDIESLPFLEAQRQLNYELGLGNYLNIHLTYVPYIAAAKELKTKPTQHSVRQLMQYGIKPDVLLCRSEHPLLKDTRDKIALFCNVDEDAVFEARDVDTIYEVPLFYARKRLTETILEKLDIEPNEINLDTWSKFVKRIKHPKYTVKIALVGKYTKYEDSYKSIVEAFIHAGSINNTQVELDMINSEDILDDSTAKTLLSEYDGVLIAPGFGNRGIEGKLHSIKYIRENKIPFFGICLGMQCAVIEFARNVCGLGQANSSEFEKNDQNVIDLMADQVNVEDKGGTMRLGAYPCKLEESSKSYAAYGTEEISERHRHRYEVSNQFREVLQENGLKLAGLSPDGNLVEIIELEDHPWFVGVQFHPELKSRAVSGHPLFTDFVKAVLKNKKNSEV
ncbi:MAG: CTP synthase [Ignavibacteriae bacterium HGW-Ignavibacteriae-4]|nr:MAG: CTP synthase [Ignavibacteriae bacterium HGW-Ignavibacteriae-4]